MFKKQIRSLSIVFVFAIVLLGFNRYFFQAAKGEQDADSHLLQVRRLIKDFYYHQVDDSILEKSSVEEIVKSLDSYSVYLTNEEADGFSDRIDYDYQGIGVRVEENDMGLGILEIFPLSGAADSGMEVGDIVTKVEGIEVNTLGLKRAIEKIRGEAGSKVQLEVYRSSKNELFNLLVERKKIHVPIVETKRLGANIGYIRLYSFGKTSADEMVKALHTLEGVEGYLFDLRDNGGGYLEVAQEVLGLFQNIDQAVRVRNRNQEEKILPVVRQSATFDARVALIINKNSASASELVAGSLRDNREAVLFGQTTFGKGTVQSLYRIFDGSLSKVIGFLKLTTSEFLTPKGNKIHNVGVHPNIYTEKDNEVKEAYQYLLENQTKDYHDLGEITKGPQDRSIYLRFNKKIPTEIVQQSVEITTPEGLILPYQTQEFEKNGIRLTLEEDLQAFEYLHILVHPGLLDIQGKQLKKGVKARVFFTDEI